MLPKPSAVVFDLGKVLLDFDYGLVIRRVAARGRAGVPEIHRLLLESPLLPAFERGELAAHGFFAEVRDATGFDGTYQEFAEFFGDIFTEIPPMVALQAELRARGVRTYIFSNTNILAIELVRRVFPFFQNFDGYVLSYEHGVMKPDAPLYEAVEKLTGCRGAELMYLDDRPENYEAGRARGWQAILHVDPADSRRRVQAVGLLG